VPERTTGSWERVNPRKKERKRGTHVADSDGEEEEKDPEVEVEPLARRSAPIGHPEREEPEQPRCVEGNCQIGLSVVYVRWLQTTRKMLPTKEIKSAIMLRGFTPPSPNSPTRKSCPSMHLVANKSKTANNGTVVKSSGR
jgi:hypothetical protein